MADTEFAGLDSAVGDVLHANTQTAAMQIRNNVQFALDANPDQEARYKHLANAVGVPIETVRAQPAAITVQAGLQQMDADRVATEFPHMAKFLTDPVNGLTNTRMTHDDFPGLAAVEGAVRQLPPRQTPDAPDATEWQPSVGQRVRQWLDDAFGLTEREHARAQTWYAAQGTGMTPDKARQAVGGMSEAPMQAATGFLHSASFGVVPALAGEAQTGAGAVASGLGNLAGFLMGPLRAADALLGKVGIGALDHVAGESFAKAIARDVGSQALKLGTASALAQTGTALDSPDVAGFLAQEGKAAGSGAAMGGVFGAAGRLLPDTTLPQGIARALGVNAALDAAQGKTPFEDLANWGQLTGTQRADAVFNYALNTLFSLKGAGRVSGDWLHDAARADIAAQDMATIQQVGQAAAASKLRERDPAAFRQWVEGMTDDGKLMDAVYIDARTLADALNQSGVRLPDIQRTMPDLLKQLDEGLDTNGDVRIPTADYATFLAGTDADAAILPHLRAEPDGMTYAQAQEFYQGQLEGLTRKADEILAQKAGNEAFAADRQQVFDKVLEQLNTAGRFTPDVNRTYATLARDFYVTTAERLGVKPSELLERYPLKVAVERMVEDAKRFDQEGVTVERAPAGTFMSARSEAGSVGGHVRDGALHISTAEVGEEKRGLGEGVKLYRALIDKALSDGLKVYSDSTVEAAAVRIYDSLKRRGYDVRRMEGGQLEDGAVYGKGAAAPAFEVVAGPAGRSDTLQQTQPAPIAHLTGEEIAAKGSGIKELRTAASDYYTQHLAGTVVHNAELGDVAFSKRGMKKMLSSSANPDKLKLVAALPSILENGRVIRSAENEASDTHKNIVRYHWIRGDVQLEGRTVSVDVNVEEHRDGKLYYNHTLPGSEYFQEGSVQARNPSRPGVVSSAERSTDGEHPSEAIGSGPPETTIPQEADRFNLMLNQEGSGSRGAYSPETGTIALLKNADLSTFLHELGHHFLELTADLASRADAPAEIRGDFDKLLGWFGVKDAAAWHALGIEGKRPLHEQFARGFEAYLMEGKAPSVEAAGLFARFRTWLLNVYRSLTALNVELTPEVRGVFDRMLASEDAIKAAEQVRGYAPLFKSAEAAGMTPEQFAAYQREGAAATETAVEDLERRSLRDMQWLANAKSRALKDLQKEAASKRKEVRAEVEREVAAEPIYAAERWLKHGEMTDADGNAVKAEKGYKLDLGALREMYPEGSLARPDLDALGRGKYALAGKDGLHPDLVAEMFGFPSGDALVRSLIDAPDRREVIDAMTDQRMLERYGELADPAAIERAAEAAIHNEARARFVATEYKALTKATGPARQIAEAAKAAAESSIASKRVRDVRPAQYAASEARAARNADKALIGGDLSAAANEKRAQLLNNRLVKAAEAALEDVRKGVQYLRKFDKAGVREGLELEYREQIDALLEQYDLRSSVSGRELNRRQSLRDWYAAQVDRGYNPAIPDYLMDAAGKTHYKDMAVEQFRGLVDAVKSIEHLGRLKQRLLDLKDMRDFNEVVTEAIDGMAKLPQRTPESNRGLTRAQEKWLGAKTMVQGLDASLLKMEQMLDWLDNHNANGVFNRVVFRRIADAGVRENDLRTSIADKLRELSAAMPKDAQRDLSRIIEASELIDSRTGRPSRFTKSQILAMALNTGNESNFAKMAAGERWTDRAIWQVLDRNMTKADWDFVQGVWDAVESLWPEIEAMERRLGNSAPPKVAAREINTPHGTYRGGYYPVVYDPLRSFDVEQNRQRGGDQLFENNYVRATTPKGHTIERTENYARPLLLSLDVLPRHLAQVIHDLAYREAVIDADRFLADSRIREGIEGALGREYYKQLRPWLQAIANDKTYDSKGLAFWDKAAHWARTNATMVGLGYRITTMLIHGSTAASNSVGEIGAKWFASGVKACIGSPERMAAARDFVFERSGEMRNRMNEVDRDVRDALREMELHAASGPLGVAERAIQPVRRFAYYGISMLDMASALPTWMGAYNKGLHEGLAEQDAIYAADKAVRNAHGGGGVKDLAAAQRGDEFKKLFTMFYSFWNHFYNRQRDIARTAGGIPEQIRQGDYQGARRDFAMVLARSWFYFIIPQLLHAALKPPAPGQENEEKHWAVWAAEEIGLGLFSGVPVARDIANSAFTGRDYTATPAVSIVENAGRTSKDIEHAVKGEEVSDKWLKHAVTTAGYVFGLPTGQPANAVQFLWDLADNKQNPQDLADWYRGLVHGDMTRH